MSHENRSKKNPRPLRNPSAEEVVKLRHAAGMDPSEAARSVHASRVAWAEWESGERPMHPVFWRLFRVVASEKTVGRVSARLIDPDEPTMWTVSSAQNKSRLGVIAGPVEHRWACFYATSLGEPRPSGLNGCYEHRTIEDAMAAFEKVLED